MPGLVFLFLGGCGQASPDLENPQGDDGEGEQALGDGVWRVGVEDAAQEVAGVIFSDWSMAA